MFWAVTLSSANRILSDTSQNTFVGEGNEAKLLANACEVNGKGTSVPNEVYLLPCPKVLALSFQPMLRELFFSAKDAPAGEILEKVLC